MPDLTPQAYLVRIVQQPDSKIDPKALFKALKKSGITSRRVGITTEVVRVLTHPGTAAQIGNLLNELKAPSPRQAVVIPLMSDG